MWSEQLNNFKALIKYSLIKYLPKALYHISRSNSKEWFPKKFEIKYETFLFLRQDTVNWRVLGKQSVVKKLLIRGL